ncbi:MAG: diguanylate cyclase [Anaerolineaceae bacterium]|nr:diguanylate cyclase [Anaerolineaceae bacterium]
MAKKNSSTQSDEFEYLIKTLPEGVIIVDHSGMIVFSNKKARDILNPGGGDIPFKTFNYKISVTKVTEIELHRPKQSPQVLEIRAAEIDWLDQPAYLITLVDISESKRSESAFKKSQEKIALLFEANPDCVMLTYLDGGEVIDVNDGFVKLSGYQKEEVLDRKTTDFNLWADISDREDYIQRLSTTGECIDYEVQLVTKDGWVMPVNISARVLELDEQLITLAIIRDISQYKNSERALQRANEKLSVWIDELEMRNREASLLNEMGDMLQSCLSLEEAYKVVGKYAEQLFAGQAGALYIYNQERKALLKKNDWGEVVNSSEEFEPEDCWAIRRGHAHEMIGNKNTLLCNHITQTDERDGFIQNICIPLIAQGDTLGSIYLQLQPGQDIEHWKQLGVSLAERAALDFANQRLRYKLHQQSIRDPLTGLFNRRYMEETLHREIRRAVRHGSLLSIAMIDVDHFKLFNDKFGHEIGDQVLKEMSLYLQHNLRVEDVVCRFGGEEFIVILPDASLEDTERRALQWKETIKKIHVGHYDQAMDSITISVGVATFPKHGDSVDTLLRAVDDALYAAKDAGRDSVKIAKPSKNNAAE